jgi:hypothetical protein
MIKVDMTSPDLDRQIELLKVYPEIMEKHFKPTLYRAVKGMESRIRPTIPVGETGRAQATFRSKVTGKGINLTGRVGWYGKNDPIYPNMLEYGAKPHPLNKGTSIRKSKKKTAIFNAYISDAGRVRGEGTHVKIGGRWVTMESHPGFSARGFMAAGYSAMQPVINALLAQANEAVVKDLALS